MGTRVTTESKVDQVVVRLVQAWESGNRLRLAVAAQQARLALNDLSADSPFEREVRELLLSVVVGLEDLLNTDESADPWEQSRSPVCNALLRHAQEVIVASGGQA